jgi:PAS domain S-box-containing protein
VTIEESPSNSAHSDLTDPADRGIQDLSAELGARATDRSQRQRMLHGRTESAVHDHAAKCLDQPDLMSLEDTRAMLHELQVHQIELKIQNEELRRVQAALDTERARYFELYDLAPVGYFTLSIKGLVLQANRRANDVLGVARGALERKRFSQFILEQDQDAYYLLHHRLLKSGDPQSCDLRLVRCNGTPIWMHLDATVAQDAGGHKILLITLNDLAERKHAEQQRLRNLIEWTREATAVHRDGILVYVNPAAITMFGAMSAQDLLGKPMLDLVHPDDHQAVLERIRSLAPDQPATLVYEERMFKLDGVAMDVEVQRSRTDYEGGSAIQVAMRDITDHKFLNQTLLAKNDELNLSRSVADKANLAKSEFISSMSHELRAPLNSILGFAQLMELGSPTAVQKGNLDQILKAGWHLLELINEILDLSHIESGKAMRLQEPVSLHKVMLECRAMMEPQAQSRSIAMTFPRFDVPCFVMADPTRIKQVLINLLSNAIKYNQPGGAVWVECSLSLPDSVRISVRDTGAGLTAQQLAQLFQPFNRLGRDVQGEEGTGIGLVVCKRLVELMGGRIGADSTVGVGSVFWIELRPATAPPSNVPISA